MVKWGGSPLYGWVKIDEGADRLLPGQGRVSCEVLRGVDAVIPGLQCHCKTGRSVIWHEGSDGVDLGGGSVRVGVEEQIIA